MGYINFFISKFRYKLSFACVTGLIIILVNGLLMDMTIVEILRGYGTTFLILLAISAYFWYPAFKYFFTDAEEAWKRWGRYGRQKKRKEFSSVKFARVYKETKYAIAKEPDKGYRIMTTLDECNCVEFRKNHVPCRHMYKLADHLGLYEYERRD